MRPLSAASLYGTRRWQTARVMPNRGPQLPQFIVLEATPQMDAAAIVAAFNRSKQVMWLWRTHYNFPTGTRHSRTTITRTSEIAAWAYSRGITIFWV
jgi:hypothetical protein